MKESEISFLTKEEKELVAAFRCLSEETKEYILFQIKVAAKNK